MKDDTSNIIEFSFCYLYVSTHNAHAATDKTEQKDKET